MRAFREQFEFEAHSNLMTGGIDLYGINREGHSVLTEVQGKSVSQGELIDPFLKLSKEQAQHLANSLWNAGFRPVQANGSEGQIGAVIRHLEDMRMIVFHRLGIEKREG